MGRKPVLGLAGMFLAGVTLTGCETTDWCCWGKKTPEATQTRNLPPKAQPRMPVDTPDTTARNPLDEHFAPVERGTVVPTGLDKRPGLTEENEIVPPKPPEPVGKVDPADLLPPLPGKSPAPVTETSRLPKIVPPENTGPSLDDDVNPNAPPPPSPVAPEKPAKSSSNYQDPSEPPPPPTGVPMIKGGAVKEK